MIIDEPTKMCIRDRFQTAVADARSKADELASSLGIKVVGVQTASINDVGSVQPVYRETAVAEATESTPIQPGETTVSLSVQVTYIVN